MKKIVDEYDVLEYIYKNVILYTSDIQSKFSISLSTTHRILKKLSSNSWIYLDKDKIIYMPFKHFKCEDINYEKRKNAIAYKATEIIEEGDIVCLAGGSTTVALVLPFIILKKKNIFIITNGVLAVRYYLSLEKTALQNNISLLTIGGTVQNDCYSFGGEYASEVVNKLHINKTFISTQGADITRGLFVDEVKETYVETKFTKTSKDSFLLINSEKFHKRKFFKWGDWKDFDGVITDYKERTLDFTPNFKHIIAQDFSS